MFGYLRIGVFISLDFNNIKVLLYFVVYVYFLFLLVSLCKYLVIFVKFLMNC